MAFLKVIMEGTIAGGEVWSVGTSWGIFGLAPDTPDQSLTDGILAGLLTYSASNAIPAAFKTALGIDGAFTTWRVEYRDETEHIMNVSIGTLASAQLGTGVSTKTPQDALVLSLRTATPGPSGRGRLYWPALGAGLGAGFQLSSPTPGAFVAAWKTWLNAIGGVMNAYYAGISSPKTVVLAVRSVKNHICRNVNELQCGSLLDTQRRRRDNLIETYSNLSYP